MEKKNIKNNSAELNDEELDNVSGGVYNPSEMKRKKDMDVVTPDIGTIPGKIVVPGKPVEPSKIVKK